MHADAGDRIEVANNLELREVTWLIDEPGHPLAPPAGRPDYCASGATGCACGARSSGRGGVAR